MPYAVIDDGAVIGDNTVIFPHVYIGKNVRVGVGCELNPGVVIHENSILGDRVVLRSHAVIGGQGFGFSTDEQGHHTHIRQLGKAILKDDVEVGASSAVDNGAMNDTVVGRGTKIDNLVHLGHNVEVGEDCFYYCPGRYCGKYQNREFLYTCRADRHYRAYSYYG